MGLASHGARGPRSSTSSERPEPAEGRRAWPWRPFSIPLLDYVLSDHQSRAARSRAPRRSPQSRAPGGYGGVSRAEARFTAPGGRISWARAPRGVGQACGRPWPVARQTCPLLIGGAPCTPPGSVARGAPTPRSAPSPSVPVLSDRAPAGAGRSAANNRLGVRLIRTPLTNRRRRVGTPAGTFAAFADRARPHRLPQACPTPRDVRHDPRPPGGCCDEVHAPLASRASRDDLPPSRPRASSWPLWRDSPKP